MTEDREQRDKVMESMGEGSARCIRLTILFVLALSGIILQGLVYYYDFRRPKESGVPWEYRFGLSSLSLGF